MFTKGNPTGSLTADTLDKICHNLELQYDKPYPSESNFLKITLDIDLIREHSTHKQPINTRMIHTSLVAYPLHMNQFCCYKGWI